MSSEEEILPLDCGYKVLKSLHQGSDSVVYDVIRISDNVNLIAKILDSKNKEGNSFGPANPNEIAIQSTFDHNNIMHIDRLVGKRMCDIKGIGMVMEKGGKSFIDIIIDNVLSFDDSMLLLVQALQALEFLHSRGYMHLDVKYDNFIVHDGVCKLIDFGLSAKTKDVYGEGVTMYSTFPFLTKVYCPPELQYIFNDNFSRFVTNGIKYTGKIDVWLMGYVIAGILGRGALHSNQDDTPNLELRMIQFNNAMREEKSRMGILNQHLNKSKSVIPGPMRKDFLNILMVMMNPDPVKRPTISQVLQYAPFKRYIYQPKVARVITIASPAELGIGARYYVKDIHKYLSKNHPQMSSEVFFLAVDIFYRVYHTVEGPTTPLQVLAHRSMMAASLWLAIKMVNGFNTKFLQSIVGWISGPSQIGEWINPSKPISNNLTTIELQNDPKIFINYMLRMESDIIIALKGDIHRQWIHDGAGDVGELVYAYRTYIRFPSSYFTYDPAYIKPYTHPISMSQFDAERARTKK